MVDVTFGDLQSQFLILPKGRGFLEYPVFEEAYENLKKSTSAFRNFNEKTIKEALRQNALSFVILRTIMGLTPPEWAQLAKSEPGSDVTQGAVRGLDNRVRRDKEYFSGLRSGSKTDSRTTSLISAAVQFLEKGATMGSKSTLHRLEKFDTQEGLPSLRTAASINTPYCMVLYERFLGRPFASHRDSVSELVGNVMESAAEDQMAAMNITFHKTKRAEKIPNLDQAPDFIVPDAYAQSVLIEAKIAEDDGTARDKVNRITHLAEIRDARKRNGEKSFELIACIDGRGFGVRRADMKKILIATEGKVFTLKTVDKMVEFTSLRDFVPK
jgi:hypothetical protein